MIETNTLIQYLLKAIDIRPSRRELGNWGYLHLAISVWNCQFYNISTDLN